MINRCKNRKFLDETAFFTILFHFLSLEVCAYFLSTFSLLCYENEYFCTQRNNQSNLI